MRQTNIITFRQFYKQKYLEMAEIFDRQQSVTPQQQSVTPPPPPPPPPNPTPYPEFSSLIDFLNKENYPTYFGCNFKLLINVLSNNIPPNSHRWHPQNTWEWVENQPGICWPGVVVALIFHLIDRGLAWQFCRKYKIKPSCVGKVKMTVSHFSHPTIQN
jgi:hypothetical protein